MITLFIGKSASGKDYLCKSICKGHTKPIISYTTRPMRSGEQQDVDYHFVSTDKFTDMIACGDLLEYRCYDVLDNGTPSIWFYGTPKLDVKEEYAGVATINVAYRFIEEYGSDNITVIYVIADDEVRELRARMRDENFREDEWKRRTITDADDFSDEKLKKLEDYLGKPLQKLDNN